LVVILSTNKQDEEGRPRVRHGGGQGVYIHLWKYL